MIFSFVVKLHVVRSWLRKQLGKQSRWKKLAWSYPPNKVEVHWLLLGEEFNEEQRMIHCQLVLTRSFWTQPLWNSVWTRDPTPCLMLQQCLRESLDGQKHATAFNGCSLLEVSESTWEATMDGTITAWSEIVSQPNWLTASCSYAWYWNGNQSFATFFAWRCGNLSAASIAEVWGTYDWSCTTLHSALFFRCFLCTI